MSSSHNTNANSSCAASANGGSTSGANGNTNGGTAGGCNNTKNVGESNELSKTNLYIRGLGQNTTDKDLISMCSQ